MGEEITCGSCGSALGQNPDCEDCREWAKRGRPPEGRAPPGGKGWGFARAMATGGFQPPRWVWAVLVVAFLYLISPVDLVPDLIFPVGLVDDLLVVAAALTAAREAFVRYQEREAGGG